MIRDVRSSESCAHRYGSLGSPYEARSTNHGVVALNVLIFLAGCTAEAIALETGSEIALAAQQVFGVATALIGVGTLFALTPLGWDGYRGSFDFGPLDRTFTCSPRPYFHPSPRPYLHLPS